MRGIVTRLNNVSAAIAEIAVMKGPEAKTAAGKLREKVWSYHKDIFALRNALAERNYTARLKDLDEALSNLEKVANTLNKVIKA